MASEVVVVATGFDSVDLWASVARDLLLDLGSTITISGSLLESVAALFDVCAASCSGLRDAFRLRFPFEDEEAGGAVAF